MHLGLGRTRFDAFRFGSGPLTMELISTVHVAEQWRHGEVQKKKKKKKKGKGKEKGWLVLCCKARHCYCVVTQLQQKQPQAVSIVAALQTQ